MNRKEYMEELKDALAQVDEDLSAEIMEDYEEHFENGLKYGKTEEQICLELGDIQELVKELDQFHKAIDNQPHTNIIQGIDQSTNSLHPMTLADKEKEEQEQHSKMNEQQSKMNEQQGRMNEQQSRMNEQQSRMNEQQSVMGEQQSKNEDHKGKDKELDLVSKNSQSQDLAATQIIVKAIFADVNITRSHNSKIEVNCYHEGDRKQQMIYRFNTWQEGNCIYAEVVRENSNIGIFNFMKTPYMRINITVPENFPVIEINSASGNIDCTGIVVNNAKFTSASGDIQVKVCTAKQLIMGSKSGSLHLNRCEGESLTMDSASGEEELSELQFDLARVNTYSGDINVNHITGDHFVLKNQSGDIEVYDGTLNYLETHSISGDIQVQNVKAKTIKGQTTSGDVNINDINSEHIDINSTSGDLDGRNLAGLNLYATSKSGDIDMDTNAKDSYLKTLSGSIKLNTVGDIKVQADSISGDIDIRINNQGNGYEASVHSVSGDQSLSFGRESHTFYKDGKYIFGNSACKLELKTTSGDINIRG